MIQRMDLRVIKVTKKHWMTAGIPLRDEYVRIGNYRYESSVDAVKYFLELSPRPTAIFSATDEMAIGAIHTIQDNGLQSTARYRRH